MKIFNPLKQKIDLLRNKYTQSKYKEEVFTPITNVLNNMYLNELEIIDYTNKVESLHIKIKQEVKKNDNGYITWYHYYISMDNVINNESIMMKAVLRNGLGKLQNEAAFDNGFKDSLLYILENGKEICITSNEEYDLKNKMLSFFKNTNATSELNKLIDQTSNNIVISNNSSIAEENKILSNKKNKI